MRVCVNEPSVSLSAAIQRHLVEGLSLALETSATSTEATTATRAEAATSSTVAETTTAATTTTASAVTEATTAATAATATTTTATTTAEATTLLGLTLCGVVKTDSTSTTALTNVATVLAIESNLGILYAVECNVTKALAVARLLVSRQTQTLDLSNVGEELGDDVLISLPGKVADEESVTLGGDGIAVSLGAVVGTVTGSTIISRLGLGGVESQTTALELETLHTIESSLALLGGAEINVAEATGSLHVLVGNNASTVKTLVVLEGLVQDVISDTPAEVANEKSDSLGLLGIFGLSLLGGSGLLVVSLALLGGLGLGLLGGVRVIRIVRAVLVFFFFVGVGVGVGGLCMLSIWVCLRSYHGMKTYLGLSLNLLALGDSNLSLLLGVNISTTLAVRAVVLGVGRVRRVGRLLDLLSSSFAVGLGSLSGRLLLGLGLGRVRVGGVVSLLGHLLVALAVRAVGGVRVRLDLLALLGSLGGNLLSDLLGLGSRSA